MQLKWVERGLRTRFFEGTANKPVRRPGFTFWSRAFQRRSGVCLHLSGSDVSALPGLDFTWSFDDFGNHETAPVNATPSTYVLTSVNQGNRRGVTGTGDFLRKVTASDGKLTDEKVSP
jgi:hypothetical protein